jgi:hypothetical protein
MISKQGTVGKRKHVTLMIPQKLEIIMLESGKRTEVKASHNTGSSTIYDIKKWKEPLQSLVAPPESVKDFFKQGTETA